MKQFKDTVRWLHISDLHFKDNSPYQRERVLNAFIQSLPQLLKRSGPLDLLFLTGDLANSEKSEEYKEATSFLDLLLERTGLTKANLFLVPGNHDVDRSLGKLLSRTLTSTAQADDTFSLSEDILHITQRQRAFSSWYDEYFSNIRRFPTNSSLLGAEHLSIRAQTLNIVPLNSAIFSIDDADHGKLWIGERTIDTIKEWVSTHPADLTIALLHHPLEWLAPIEQTNAATALRSCADIILNGHLHVTNAEAIAGVQASAAHLAAGAMYEDSTYPKTAMVGQIMGEIVVICPIRYEGTPSPVWTVDPSLYPQSDHYEGSIDLANKELSLRSVDSAIPSNGGLPIDQRDQEASAIIGTSAARSDFEADLFVIGDEKVLYVEPRIYTEAQDINKHGKKPEQVSIEDIVKSNSSYIIECRVEYGGSTLCKRLAFEFANQKTSHVYRKDARILPNYKKKLEGKFAQEGKDNGQLVLILDNLDLDQHERLLRELTATKWFKRIIAVTTNRTNRPGRLIDPATIGMTFSFLYLWSIKRNDVRQLAAVLFNSGDDTFISTVVDKVYRDLLDLRIPLTPSNVIMYLKVLNREGDFQPLNRVDIVAHYLAEVLARPSDAYRDAFTAKNKIEILSSFAHALYEDKRSDFDETYWQNFSRRYQDQTLSEFDTNAFLQELLTARIVVRFAGVIFFKYSFFFTYFVGKYIASRPERLKIFMETDEYLTVFGLIEVITGINSDNTFVLEHVTIRHEKLLDDFSKKYLSRDLDPLVHAIWPESEHDEKNIWEPVTKELHAPSKSGAEIDIGIL